MGVSYDFDRFVEEQLGKTRDQILVALEHELIMVDYKLKGTRRARARAGGALTYRRMLAALARWLNAGKAPRAPVSEDDLRTFGRAVGAVERMGAPRSA